MRKESIFVYTVLYLELSIDEYYVYGIPLIGIIMLALQRRENEKIVLLKMCLFFMMNERSMKL